MISKSLQDNPKVLLIFFLILGVDQDVINEYHNELVQLWHEHRIHQVHEMRRSIGESKRYDQIFIQPVSGGECCFRYVFWTDLDLMVAWSEVYLGENLSTSQLIKHDINVGKWILILDSDSIQRPVINT
jgi:hypothetical protein